jgi:hypothetical protein
VQHFEALQDDEDYEEPEQQCRARGIELRGPRIKSWALEWLEEWEDRERVEEEEEPKVTVIREED